MIGHIFDSELPPIETLLLIALADYADHNGRCWPSKETLARRSRVSKRTVDKYIKRLADGEWLKIEVQGGRKSNNYVLNLDKILAVQPCKPCTPKTEKEHSTLQALHPSHASHVAPELSIEVKNTGGTKTPPVPDAKKSQAKEHSWFSAWWCFAYAQIVGEKYAFQKKDAGQIKQLLSKLGLAETVCRACVYFDLPPQQRFPRGSPTVGGLLHQINEVVRFDRDLEDRFIAAGLLPDESIILTAFQPWEKKTDA